MLNVAIFCLKLSDVKGFFYHNVPGLFLEHWKASKIIVPHCDKKMMSSYETLASCRLETNQGLNFNFHIQN